MPLIRELVASEAWGFSEKVFEALDDCEYMEDDLESCVCTGKLYKRERDEKGEAVDGWKYTIVGTAVAGYEFYVAGKILIGEDGKYFFFITAHQAE